MRRGKFHAFIAPSHIISQTIFRHVQRIIYFENNTMSYSKKMQYRSRLIETEQAIDSFLDRIACFDPSKYFDEHNIASKNRESASRSSADERKYWPSQTHRGARPKKLQSSFERKDNLKYRDFSVGPVPTATMSDASPYSVYSGRRSPDSLVDYVIDVETRRKKKNMERKREPTSAYAPVVPLPRRSFKNFFLGGTSKPRPFGAPLGQQSGKSTSLFQPAVWKRRLLVPPNA